MQSVECRLQGHGWRDIIRHHHDDYSRWSMSGKEVNFPTAANLSHTSRVWQCVRIVTHFPQGTGQGLKKEGGATEYLEVIIKGWECGRHRAHWSEKKHTRYEQSRAPSPKLPFLITSSLPTPNPSAPGKWPNGSARVVSWFSERKREGKGERVCVCVYYMSQQNTIAGEWGEEGWASTLVPNRRLQNRGWWETGTVPQTRMNPSLQLPIGNQNQ